MTKLPAILFKELLVLLRDPVGLAVIFLMPLAVLLVVTLVQDGAFKKVNRFSVKVALVDEDLTDSSRALTQGLGKGEGIILLKEMDGKPLNRDSALKLVRDGGAQVLVVFPKGLDEASTEAARYWAQPPSPSPPAQPMVPAPPKIETYFDPGVSGPYRVLVTLALQHLAQGMEFELHMHAWSGVLPMEIKDRLPPEIDPGEFSPPLAPPEFKTGHILAVAAPANTSSGKGSGGVALLPDMVQFNVPAYSVFAMFFIVIPISTCLLRERNEGTLTRLLTMPVRPAAIIAGKMFIFLCVALIQFVLMLAAGLWLLPALGTSVFTLTASLPELAALTLCTGFAAVGFALAVASTASSQEQAGMVGATSVVILAALGGVMVPVFFMPPVMQKLSGLTPINWSVTAYQDLFTRGASMADIQGRMLLLAPFGCAGLAWTWHRLFTRV